MHSSVEVIPFTLTSDEMDGYGRITARKGDVVVCHGVDHDTLKNVCLPCEPFYPFVRQHCVQVGRGYFLKK